MVHQIFNHSCLKRHYNESLDVKLVKECAELQSWGSSGVLSLSDCFAAGILITHMHTNTDWVGSVQEQQPITAGELHPTSCVVFYLAGIGWHVKFLLRECSQSEIKAGSKRRTRSLTGITVISEERVALDLLPLVVLVLLCERTKKTVTVNTELT